MAATFFDVTEVLAFHDRALTMAGWPGDPPPSTDAIFKGTRPLPAPLVDNHRCNTLLWLAEDQARRPDKPPAFIAQKKHDIDRHNQRRNDAIEALDGWLLSHLAMPSQSARLHSETAGAIVDRLSILALKCFHMARHVQRSDVAAEHLAACSAKLNVLQEQRADLARCLADLFDDIACGRAYFKRYRKFKMYNDPALNPWLQGRAYG